MIDLFDGEFAFLSNFFESPITIDDITYSTVEHFFQAAKTLNPAEHLVIANAETPGKAKRLGRKCQLRPDWEDIKIQVMEKGLRLKFANPVLRQKLLDTGDEWLIEGNSWGDTFWGICNGRGDNHLGHLLMKIRKEEREKIL